MNDDVSRHHILFIIIHYYLLLFIVFRLLIHMCQQTHSTNGTDSGQGAHNDMINKIHL